MAVHGTDANRSRDRTRLTGRSPGKSFGRTDRIYRIYDSPSVFILAPDRPRGAGVADRTSLVHGAERQRVLRAAEKAVDLDRGGIPRHDADVANRAAADAT